MTRLPFESWNIVPRLDLPAYELNAACPVTGEVAGLEDHHIVRKSFTALSKEDGKRLFWIELPDGTVVGNRVNLSQSAHYRITVNKARIAYDPDGQFPGQFVWIENFEAEPLRWQPPTYDAKHGRPFFAVAASDDEGWKYTEEKIASSLFVGHVEEGEECPACKRRVPHKKKASSPKSKVFSTRIPLDDVETFNEIVDAAAEHHGLKAKPHHVYWTLLYAVTLLLQQEKGELPV